MKWIRMESIVCIILSKNMNKTHAELKVEKKEQTWKSEK